MLRGYKTYIAAALVALLAVNHFVQFLPVGWEDTILVIANALGLVGLRDALTQVLEAVNAVKRAGE